MKNLFRLVSNALVLFLLTCTAVFAQVPAEQEVIVIPGGAGNIGLLETTINEDVDASGNRINPNRIYQLQKDKIYIMQSAIEFGNELTDTTSTLIIIGEEGGNLPVVLMQPLEPMCAEIEHYYVPAGLHINYRLVA